MRTGRPVQDHIKYSSLTDAVALEDCIADMRAGLLGAGLDVESSNAEYGPGLIEVNISYADAMTAADATVVFKSIVKQVAVRHGLRATFMPKPWADQSGSGMHVHTSLNVDGANAFADSDGAPNELMSKWLGGLLEHARSHESARSAHRQRGQAGEALHLRPDPCALGRRQPHRDGPLHHRGRLVGQPGGVPGCGRRRHRPPDDRRGAGRRLRRVAAGPGASRR